jgi:hypothetical protein
MKISAFKRFLSEQFVGAPTWFIRFLQQLNLLTEQIVKVLTNGLTISENMDAQLYTFQILAKATANLNTTSFVCTMSKIPEVVMVGKVFSAGVTTIMTSPVQVFWTVAGEKININSITGLTSGTNYSLTLVVF